MQSIFLRAIVLLFLIPFYVSAQNEKRKVFTTTPVYDEIISTYAKLVTNSKIAKLSIVGTTAVGKPLHVVILSKDGKFDPEFSTRPDAVPVNASSKAIIMINNGIHPGEPDGIDACIELTRNIIQHPELLPDDVILVIIPVFNVDGCLNRSSNSRANQNGPEEYGFRGNAQNLDLNRDFIKCDAPNTISLEKLFRQWRPDVFIDTHVSDGADYQYVMTVITSQHSKMNPVVAGFVDNLMLPALYKSMKEKKHEMCPYVETVGETPETGIVGFLDSPRFSTGYASLFNCISFVTETHMWKPYNDRVWATYDFIWSVIEFCKGAEQLKKIHRDADNMVAAQKMFQLTWQLDTTKSEMISFNGFEAKHKLSEISGLQRMYYDRNAPYTKEIKYFNTYFPVVTVTAPVYYIIPMAYSKVIDRLAFNQVIMKRLKKDTTLNVEAYYIDDYTSGKSPYESHYLHSDVKVSKRIQAIHYYKGDCIVQVNQPCNRYIVETLEPEGDDSFFAWNFFDGILQQKEWFSDYIFEEKADSILNHNDALKSELQNKQKSDPEFAKDHWAQLYFVYAHSEYMEKSFNRYPVTRINEPAKLPLE
ncbi:M14 family metallopeptidase [soil metagenome]